MTESVAASTREFEGLQIPAAGTYLHAIIQPILIKYILDEWIPIAKTTGSPVEGIFPALNEVEGEGVMQTLAQDILQGKDVMEAMETANGRFEDIVAG